MIFRKRSKLASPEATRFTALFRLGHMHALLPGYSKAPLCEVIIGKSVGTSDEHGLHVHSHALYVATPQRSVFVGYQDMLENLANFWRAGEMLKRFDAYTPITNEVVEACCNAAAADQNPANMAARRFIDGVACHIGTAAYLEIMGLPVPPQIMQADAKHRRALDAAVAKRDRNLYKRTR